jgi:hypothetical protein
LEGTVDDGRLEDTDRRRFCLELQELKHRQGEVLTVARLVPPAALARRPSSPHQLVDQIVVVDPEQLQQRE